MGAAVAKGLMSLYSLALTAVLLIGSPYWLLRMVGSGRYRAGLSGRLGHVPAALKAAVGGRQVVWLHAVSVGEALAGTRLVQELEEALGPEWIIVVSTTTATGQALAHERFVTSPEGRDRPPTGPANTSPRVFWYPLDFAWPVRAYLRALRPRMLVLMESELWPRMVVECGNAGIPVAVVNARVSDRSFARGVKLRAVWATMLRRVTLFLAQSEEDARRLIAMGARADAVRVVGNLKYDVPEPVGTRIARRIADLRGPSQLIVAGSTLENEEQMLLTAWPRVLLASPDLILVIAPRHPDRFGNVSRLIQASGFPLVLGSRLEGLEAKLAAGTVVLLDTIGDLASTYSAASVAFLGGSLVPKGGHNPLEASRFGVPVLMGESFENFRDIVEGLRKAGAIRIVKPEQLAGALIEALRNAQSSGQGGREFYLTEAGATHRTVSALLESLPR